jgi:hypothetical protein
MITIKCFVRTNKVGSECSIEVEINKRVWDNMTQLQKDEFVFRQILESELVDTSYEVI